MGFVRGRVLLSAALTVGALVALPLPAVSLTGADPTPPADAGAQPPVPEPDADATGELENAHDELVAASRRVQEAQQALELARSDLDRATEAVRVARDEVQAAEAADEEARVALEAAVAAEQKTRREIAEILDQVDATRSTLGAVARDVYRGGELASLEVVLQADSPGEFADRYADMQAVMKAGEGILGRLAVNRADLTNKQDRLTALRALQQELRAEAARALEAKLAAKESAETAEQQRRALVEEHETAVAAAEEARAEDFERYQRFLAESRALADTILARAGDVDVDATGDFVRPGTGVKTSDYGPRRHPILGYVKTHTGTDLGRGDGYIYAADSGTVTVAAYSGGYGNMVVLDHGTIDGRQVSTLYAHQARLYVSPGDRVAQGQRIGVVGSTGYSTGPHLHFEVRLDGTPTDPWPWIGSAPLPALAGG